MNKTTILRKPYRIEVYIHDEEPHHQQGWAVARRWYRERYEGAHCKIVVNLDSGKQIEVS